VLFSAEPPRNMYLIPFIGLRTRDSPAQKKLMEDKEECLVEISLGLGQLPLVFPVSNPTHVGGKNLIR